MQILYIELSTTSLPSDYYRRLLNESAASGTIMEIRNFSRSLQERGVEPPLLPTFWGEGVFQLGEMFRLIGKAKEAFDGVIIGCSADPGLRLAQRFDVPVLDPLLTGLKYTEALLRAQVSAVEPVFLATQPESAEVVAG